MIRTNLNDKLIAESLSNVEPINLNFPQSEMMETRSTKRASDDKSDSPEHNPCQKIPSIVGPPKSSLRMEPKTAAIKTEDRQLDITAVASPR